MSITALLISFTSWRRYFGWRINNTARRLFDSFRTSFALDLSVLEETCIDINRAVPISFWMLKGQQGRVLLIVNLPSWVYSVLGALSPNFVVGLEDG